MDGTRFDDLVRALMGGASRRLFLRLSTLPLAGGLAAFLLDDDESEAKKHKNKNKKKKKQRKKKKRKSKVDCSAADVCARGCRYSSVQDAINDAEVGATIRICAGTFTGNLVIEQDVTLIGFGQGTGSGDTILRGNGAESVVIIEAGAVRIEQLRITGGGMTSSGGGIHIVSGATLQLSGCTVTGNNTNDGYGNGIYNEGTLTVDDCTISENGLDAPGAPYGGAIYNGGTLTVTNSALTGNRANSGAGLYEISSAAAITLTGCDISDNVAVPDAEYEAQGGAIYSWSDASFEVTGCTIRSNSGAVNGGAVYLLSTTAVFTDCEISGNSANAGGGGIYNSSELGDATLTLDNTDVTGNSANTGGGILNTGNDATVSCTGSTVSGNDPDQCVNAEGGSGCNTCAAP